MKKLSQLQQNSFYALLIVIFFTTSIYSQNFLSVTGSADFVSRYVWRGLLVNNSPNIQPSLSITHSGLSFGFWGSYALSKISKSEDDFGTSQEIDTWMSYTLKFNNGVNLSALVTDYYFPLSGIKIGNFNNYDNPNGTGAHTLELGISVSGNDFFPMSFSGFVNVYNDKGNNFYFEINYLSKITDYDVNIFVGATGGSKSNPAYYGTDKISVINIGIKLQREIKVSNNFLIPLSVSYTLNPKAEISYLIFGISI